MKLPLLNLDGSKNTTV
jgi:large subunit ribosomal protein L4